MRQPDLPGGDGADDSFEVDDLWDEASVMVQTIDADELTDPTVGTERLLYRLFHERGVKVYPPQAVYDKCSCSREKLRDVLASLSQDDIDHAAEDGLVSVTCEFCSTTYRFEATEVKPQ